MWKYFFLPQVIDFVAYCTLGNGSVIFVLCCVCVYVCVCVCVCVSVYVCCTYDRVTSYPTIYLFAYTMCIHVHMLIHVFNVQF